LPTLTSQFSLPLLRPDACNPFESPATPFWVHLIWLTLFAGPSLILAYAWKADSREELLARWVTGMAIYTPVPVIIFLITVSGLVGAQSL